jgi:hypothetical protein
MVGVEVVILDVRNSEEAGKYVVEMTIGDAHEVFVFGDSSVSSSLSYEKGYERAFAGLAGSKQIIRVVLDFRSGKKLVLPHRLQVFRLERGEKPPSFR